MDAALAAQASFVRVSSGIVPQTGITLPGSLLTEAFSPGIRIRAAVELSDSLSRPLDVRRPDPGADRIAASVRQLDPRDEREARLPGLLDNALIHVDQS
jgi:hypothetical protein